MEHFMKNTRKYTYIALIIITTLAIAFSTIYYIMSKDINNNLHLSEYDLIEVHLNGELQGTINYESIITLGEENFNAVYKTSKNIEAVTKTYTGVLVKNILIYFDIDLTALSSVVVSAADNYFRAYSKEQILSDSEIYLCYKVNDQEFLKGLSQSEEGRENGGTYITIVKSEQFSQNRCKSVVKIDVIT